MWSLLLALSFNIILLTCTLTVLILMSRADAISAFDLPSVSS